MKSEDGTYNLDPVNIFPTITRDNLQSVQQSIFDKILNQMRLSWGKKSPSLMINTIKTKKEPVPMKTLKSAH